MRIHTNGNVGIGTGAPSERLDVQGNVRFSGALMPGGNPGTSGQVLVSQGAGTAPVWQPLSSLANAWLLTGNAGTNPNTNFLGTTDAQPLVIRTNNTERMRVTANGNVGIGTTAPIHRLDVRGGPTYTTRSWTGNVSLDNGGAIAWDKASPTDYTFGIGKTSTPPGFYFWSSTSDLGSNTNPPTYLMQIDYITGNVGIGTTLPPAYRLHVVGNVYANNFITPSDQRWKTNIKPIQNALDNVLKMQGVTYYWKVDEYPDKHFPEGEQVGFIAQEIEKVYPQVVLTDKEGHKSVDYSKLTPVLVEAIKEQQKIIEELQKVIQQLQEENSQIKQANAQLSAEIKMLNEKVDNLINSLSNDKKLGYR